MSQDRDYRVLCIFMRDDRQKYWVFYCPHCQQPVAEVNNYALQAMTDTFVKGDRHKIKQCKKGSCRMKWYFEFSN